MYTQPGSDDPTQEELLDDLFYGTQREQEGALERLAAVGNADALDAITDYLRTEPSENVPDAALEALRVLATKFIPLDRYGLAEALIPYLAAEDWEDRLSAVRLLNNYPNELVVEPLRDLVEEAREKVYVEQRRRPSQTRAVAERTLGESIMALANAGRLIVLPEILDMLDDPTLRIVATRALGIIGSETQRPLLEDLIEDRDPRVRDAAQWALGLMDERAEQFMNPPTEIPTPPPGRLNPLYWSHRQLEASQDDLHQFLIVRVALEHLLLDQHLSKGRIPERCVITLRRYDGTSPPDPRDNHAEVIGIWEYRWDGPTLRRRMNTVPPAQANRPAVNKQKSDHAEITISYPAALDVENEGLVSFDCHFEPVTSQGWIYKIAHYDSGWTFIRQRSTWAS